MWLSYRGAGHALYLGAVEGVISAPILWALMMYWPVLSFTNDELWLSMSLAWAGGTIVCWMSYYLITWVYERVIFSETEDDPGWYG
jgi:hypothetical protein